MSTTPPGPPETADEGLAEEVPDPGHAAAPGAEAAAGTGLVAEALVRALDPAEHEGRRFGVPGLPVSRNHPFYLGFFGAIGVLVALGLASVVQSLASVLTLIAAAMFIALGLNPLVEFLQHHGLKRPAAVAVVFLGVVLVFLGFIAAVIPPLVTQGSELADQAPILVNRLAKLSLLHDLDKQYGIISKAAAKLQDANTVVNIFGGVLGAGKAVVSGVFGAFTVLVLTLYFLASLRSMTEAGYRLVPASRRMRVRLLSEEIIAGVGGYVAGQAGVATINAVCTYILVSILGLPYALVLAITVGVFGLIPLVGATLGAIVVVLVGLFDSLTTGIIVTVYYVVYQQIENYFIAPRIMARTVAVPGAVALIAALAGGTLLGILGALIAIPLAAGILLIVREVVEPRMDAH